jgi:hypothetical protein
MVRVAVQRRRSATARLLGSQVRIPLRSRKLVCCVRCVFIGSGLCDELIASSEESYRASVSNCV